MNRLNAYKELYLNKDIRRLDKFDISNRQIYEESFNELKRNGVIVGCDFNSNTWVSVSGGIRSKLHFPNDLLLKKIIDILELNCSIEGMRVSIKAYVIKKLENNESITNADIKFIEKFGLGIEECLKIKGSLRVVSHFLKFIKLNEKKSYEVDELLSQLEYKKSATRVLPKFGDIFIFSDFVDEIIKYRNLEDYIHYFPVFLWWKITSVIPLRPSEFISMSYDCNRVSEDGNFILVVKRSKGKAQRQIDNIATVEGKYYDDVIAISEELYTLIDRFKRIMESHKYFHNNGFLISSFFNLYQKNGNINYNERLNKKRFTSYDLSKRLRNFYSEIIQTECGFYPILRFQNSDLENTIEMMCPYDARHMAIINLVYIGTEPQKVMLLAGHTEISTTESYFEHFYEYSQCYAITLARSLEKQYRVDKERKTLKGEGDKNIKSFGEKNLDKIEKDETVKIVTDYGFCINNDVRNGDYTYCNMRNLRCNGCIFSRLANGKKSETIDRMIEEEEELNIEIKAKTRVLSELINARNVSSRNRERTMLISEIKDIAFELAIVKSKRMEVLENGN